MGVHCATIFLFKRIAPMFMGLTSRDYHYLAVPVFCCHQKCHQFQQKVVAYKARIVDVGLIKKHSYLKKYLITPASSIQLPYFIGVSAVLCHQNVTEILNYFFLGVVQYLFLYLIHLRFARYDCQTWILILQAYKHISWL